MTHRLCGRPRTQFLPWRFAMRRALLMGAILFAGSLVCRADVITFDVHGTIASGFGFATPAGTIDGTITINTGTGLITGLNLEADTTAASFIGVTSATFTSVDNQFVAAGAYETHSASGSAQLNLFFPVTSLIGYGGGFLCTVDTSGTPSCPNVTSNYGNGTALKLETTSVTPEAVTATPEPSGLALLGSGALGVAGLLRRRRCC